MTLHIGSPFSHPERVRTSIENLKAVFAIVRAYFVHIPMYGATWGFACASPTLDIAAVTAPEIDKRITARAIADRRFYNGAVHHAMLALPEYIRKLIE